MDAKTTGIVAYITWIGLVIAFVLGDREGAKFHLNQALVIWLAGLLSFIPCIGWLWGIFCFICAVMGFISAVNGEEKAVPLLGAWNSPKHTTKGRALRGLFAVYREEILCREVL